MQHLSHPQELGARLLYNAQQPVNAGGTVGIEPTISALKTIITIRRNPSRLNGQNQQGRDIDG
jgi:hypothetical protein